jgi:hypothetical protein
MLDEASVWMCGVNPTLKPFDDWVKPMGMSKGITGIKPEWLAG